MNSHSGLTIWLVIWVAAILLLVIIYSKKKVPNATISLSYLCNLSLNHFFGALIYSFPWYSQPDYENAYSGFKQSTYGVIAFVSGALILVPFVTTYVNKQRLKHKTTVPNAKLPQAYIILGLILYFVLAPAIRGIPTISLLISVGWFVIIAGICLACWKDWYFKKGNVAIIKWLMAASVLPLFTMVTQGFLGFGTVPLICITLFASRIYRPRWHVFLAGIFMIYLALSFFVAYMGHRTELRTLLWEEENVSFLTKIEPVIAMFKDFEFLDLTNEEHLKTIDSRLNQNTLVGASVDYLESGQKTYAKGQTISDALLSTIPRALWQDKPMVAGSGDLVSTYTGTTFDESTSIGVGQVMEFYINFGTRGVVICFFILGLVVSFFDITAGLRLQEGNWTGFMFWFVPSFGFINSGGSLVEVVGFVVMALVACTVINKFIAIMMYQENS